MSDISFKDRTAGSSIRPYQYDGYYKYDRSVARDYEKDREVESHWQREEEFIKDYVAGRDVENLLDLPVGTGRFFRYYGRVANLVGVDISEQMLNEAREKIALLGKNTTVRLEHGDVFHLRFSDAQFDVAIVWRLLHLLPKHLLRPAISELCRVTKGELVVQSYVPINWAARIRDRFRKAGSRVRNWLSQQSAPDQVVDPKLTIKPWCHIKAYRHQEKLIDLLFRKCGFSRRESRVLDRYGNCWVKANIYVRQNTRRSNGSKAA